MAKIKSKSDSDPIRIINQEHLNELNNILYIELSCPKCHDVLDAFEYDHYKLFPREKKSLLRQTKNQKTRPNSPKSQTSSNDFQKNEGNV